MPIFRYFIFVGGALIALLFATNLVLPTDVPAQPVVTRDVTAPADLPLIRIRSDRKLPERVVLDTTRPTIALPAMQTVAATVPQPATSAELSAASSEMSSKARLRETFAQVLPAAPKADAAAPKRAEAKPLPKRKIARTRPAYPPSGRPMMVVAQQPHFGLFNMTW